jgi:hypothetical protein
MIARIVAAVLVHLRRKGPGMARSIIAVEDESCC